MTLAETLILVSYFFVLIILAVGGVATAAVALLVDIRRRDALRRADA